ncbi:MAG TPA: FHA domain-containing protein [Acidimicrobiales bacterium]|nr:FHA domain-containing protein [Acidimicrobiales bacterium]
MVTRGEVVGGVFALTGEITTVGRHGASDVFLDDVTVSRRHAEIRRTLNEYAVFDLASLNGTYLNEVRVETAVLRDGDLLQIGKFKLMFLEASAP